MSTLANQPASLQRRPHGWALLASPVRIWRFLAAKKTPWAPKLFALLTVAYLVWPVDLIPDVVPLFGWLDDVGIASFSVAWLLKKVSEATEDELRPRP